MLCVKNETKHSLRDECDLTMLTKRTHFNPCFWTAYWNKKYYEEVMTSGLKKDSRDQEIFSLNISAGKILSTKIERVHCEKNLGLSEITMDGIRKYINEYYPGDSEQHLSKLKSEEYPLLLCYENLFTKIEELPAYEVLEKVIRSGVIEDFEDKVWISSFIILQRIRGHAFINSMVEALGLLNKPKFEYMLHMRCLLADKEFLFRVTFPVATAKWTLYKSDRHRLPLCDSPILKKDRNIMVALSPRLLLEIDLNKNSKSSELPRVKQLNKNVVLEFKRRTIENTYKEIIFNNTNVLEGYLDDPLFKSRAKNLKESVGFNSIIRTTEGKEIYHIGAI